MTAVVPSPNVVPSGAAPTVRGSAGTPVHARHRRPDRRTLARWLAVVCVVATLAGLAALPARADDVSRTTADEPQYLLSALSLWEDRDLDIADELDARAYEPFHEATLPEQTKPLDGGRRVSPHDPLLPVVLAVPMGLGGWVAAKATLAVLAGALAAATAWVAVRRFAVSLPVAAGVAVAFAVVPPLVAYATQVYPELPAALVVVLVVGVVTARPFAVHHVVGATAGLVALPWLSVKFAPVVVALAAVLAGRLWSERRRSWLAAVAAVGALGAVAYLAGHQVIYGGWTPYAAGDHFVGGELTVMGSSPDHADRSVRLAGLLVDARFGLAAWAPAFLVAVPALAALVRRRPSGWAALVLPLAVGWANATWVALTMSGWWWPGRQVVVVLPLAVLAVAWWVDSVRAAHRWLVVATAIGLASWLWLVTEVLTRRRDLIIDFYETASPTYRLWALVLPDTQVPTTGDRVLLTVWLVALAASAWVGWRSVPTSPATPVAGLDPDPDRGGSP